MKKYNILFIILLAIQIAGCDGGKKDNNLLFTFDDSDFKEKYIATESLTIGILNPNEKQIDSVVYFSNDVKIGSKNGLDKLDFDLKNQKFGYQNLKAIVYFEGDTAELNTRIELVSNIVPKLLKYSIINTFSHDTLSFTEGLEFFRDTLYESTGSGNNYKSYLRKYNYKTGEIYKQINLEEKYFGEGITIINNKIFQLTYQTKTGFVYNANTWKLEKTFAYDKDIEGWGMTNDGKFIYQSDGSEKIWSMNPDNQKMINYINVYSADSKIKAVNELEWIDNKIYANVWQKDAIAIIFPKTGAVEGIVDLSSLRKLIKHAHAEALNGIAYNPKTRTIFVTGKNWEKMFEIKVLK